MCFGYRSVEISSSGEDVAGSSLYSIRGSSQKPAQRSIRRRSQTISWHEIFALVTLAAAASLSLSLTACGSSQQNLPQLNESGAETGEIEPAKSIKTLNRAGQRPSVEKDTALVTVGPRTIRLLQATNLRTKKNGILEFLVELPPNSEIQVKSPVAIDYSSYRNSSGSIVRDTNGFAAGVQVVSLAAGGASRDANNKVLALNKSVGGLFIAASTVTGLLQITQNFQPLKNLAPLAGYQMVYYLDGQPKFRCRKGLQKRFGSALNHITKVTPAAKDKSVRILNELALAVGRETPAPESYLLAKIRSPGAVSIEIEKNMKSPQRGAWTIAVLGTAKLHGFSNEPCAEFVSEEIRESYARAGFNYADDFGMNKRNPLIWSKTAAVAGLGRALVLAGWTPWSTERFVPPTGAVMMAEEGQTPGHSYFSAGAGGRFVVDNGSPQGRDLGQTSIVTLRLMYKTGVFFLPPGIQPRTWNPEPAPRGILIASANQVR